MGKRTDGSKEHILQKTFYLLLIKGYDGVSITDIQQQTGLSRGLLYHYFGSKEELFRAAAETFLTKLFLVESARTQTLDLARMIGHIVQHYKNIYKMWSDYTQGPEITIAHYDLLMYQMAARDPHIAALYAEMRHQEEAVWTAAVTLSIRHGAIRQTISSTSIARHLTTLLDGLWLQAVESKDARCHVQKTEQMLRDYYELLKP